MIIVRPRPHVAGYFGKRKLFSPINASVLDPCLNVPECNQYELLYLRVIFTDRIERLETFLQN